MGFAEWFGLSGKRALITGASRGLGREMSLALAEAGADIVITGRTQNTLDHTAAEIRALGRQAWPIKTDMAIPEECQATCERILEEIGPIDILVNNVGNREVNVAIQDESLAAWRSSIDLNLTSCFLSTRRNVLDYRCRLARELQVLERPWTAASCISSKAVVERHLGFEANG